MFPMEGPNMSYDPVNEDLYPYAANLGVNEGLSPEEEDTMAAIDYTGPFTPLEDLYPNAANLGVNEGLNPEEAYILADADYTGPFTPLLLGYSLSQATAGQVFGDPFDSYPDPFADISQYDDVPLPPAASPVSSQDDELIILFDEEPDEMELEMEMDIDKMRSSWHYKIGWTLQDELLALHELTILIELKRREGEFVAYACPGLAEMCCICQEEYDDGEVVCEVDCGHSFHVSCIKGWLLEKNVCPLCKATALSL